MEQLIKKWRDEAYILEVKWHMSGIPFSDYQDNTNFKRDISIARTLRNCAKELEGESP